MSESKRNGIVFGKGRMGEGIDGEKSDALA